MNVSFWVNDIYEWLRENVYMKLKELIKLPFNHAMYRGESYFPAEKKASPLRAFFFQAGQILRHGSPEEYYFMYGLDVKDKSERRNYVNYRRFMLRRDKLNFGRNAHNSTCLLRNKLYFDIFARAIGLETPRIVAFTSGGQFFMNTDGIKPAPIDDITRLDDTTLFCKETDGECGTGVFRLSISNHRLLIDGEEITPRALHQRLNGADYLFQETVSQHPLMSQLYPGSINTIRLVTVRSLRDGRIHTLPPILRIGAHGSFVDNTSRGGLFVEFDLESGRLDSYGYQKPEYGLRTEVHPDTGIRLADFVIPMVDKMRRSAIFFHSMLPDIHSIGWDIAIGENGPIFIEGNDNWEINGHQNSRHGLRPQFDDLFFA